MNEAIKELISALGGTITHGTIRVANHDYVNQLELQRAIEDFAPRQGWLCLTDEVMVLEDFSVEILSQRNLLSAELVRGDRSLHIRQGGNSWHGWVYCLDKHQDEIILEQRFVGTSKVAGRHLCYQTLWQPDPASNGVLQPVLSRFAGFVEGGTQS